MKTLKLAGLALIATITAVLPLAAQEKVWHHATSLIEPEPKYPADFKHFDYVNPDAPVGGTLRLSAIGSFDTFNPILPQGEPAAGIGLVYEMLMTDNLDEVSTMYGDIAEAVSYPDDYSSVSFRLNPRAKWQDGEPVTVDDVIWSFEKLKELNPNYAQYYANVTKAEASGKNEVTFSFDTKDNRELPHIVGQLLVLPKHWWEGTDADGKQRDISASTLEPPMGSGPYKLDSFVAGRSVTFKRDPNYWGATEPFGIGQNNIEELRYTYFLDQTVAFEAFKGDQIDYWQEASARQWATGYDIPAVKDGKITMNLYEEPFRSSGILFGFVPNLRLDKFKDERVRRALNYAYDFEELNKTLFFGQYVRIDSYFFGSDLRSEGLPQGKELEILESVKDLVPASVFTEPYTNPVGGDQAKRRQNLGEALKLFAEAGYTLDGDRLVDANGQQFGFEILLDNPILEPMVSAYVTNLKTIGINATIRTVDSAQYTERLRDFDYDVVYERWGQSLSPGNEQRYFWGSSTVDEVGSSNYAGISDPGVDALIDKIIFAPDRDTLIAATKALDRVLLAHNYVVPSYTLRAARIALWDRYSHPDPLPEYSIGFPTIWWWDEAKAAKTGGQ